MPVNGLRMGDWVCEIEPGVDTGAYASGDVLFDSTELQYATMDNGTSVIESITIADYDDQGVAIDLVFLRSNVSIGTVQAAVSISPAAALAVLGCVSVAATDYVDLGSRQIATVRNVGLEVRPANGTSIWVAAVPRGAPTYASGKLTIKVGMLRG